VRFSENTLRCQASLRFLGDEFAALKSAHTRIHFYG
jgi:hypothetical protein